MSYSKSVVAAAFLVVSCGASAQVHRCTDAAGKVSFSDTACPTTSKQAARVLGADATDRRWENEVYGRQRNMESIENATRILREPTSDAVGDGGGGIIQSDPNERIRAQDDRNMQRRMAEIDADRARRAERDARAEEARRASRGGPTLLTNCNATGCWDNAGNRYNRRGDGQTLWSGDGRVCRPRGNAIYCQ